MQQNQENSIKHSLLTIEERNKLSVDGVLSVSAFSPTQIILSLDGTNLIITGSDLKISEFSKSNGKFSATGEIFSVKYSTSVKFKLFK